MDGPQVLRASREEVRSIKAVVQSLKKAAGASPNEVRAHAQGSCKVHSVRHSETFSDFQSQEAARMLEEERAKVQRKYSRRGQRDLSTAARGFIRLVRLCFDASGIV